MSHYMNIISNGKLLTLFNIISFTETWNKECAIYVNSDYCALNWKFCFV